MEAIGCPQESETSPEAGMVGMTAIGIPAAGGGGGGSPGFVPPGPPVLLGDVENDGREANRMLTKWRALGRQRTNVEQIFFEICAMLLEAGIKPGKGKKSRKPKL